jgi:hypothetical protein
MELIIRRSAIPAALLVLVLLIPAPAAAAGTRFHLTFGATGFYANESLLRDIYGDFLSGYQVQASFRFAGGWSFFAGYRSLRSDGRPVILGEVFEDQTGQVALSLNSWRGGFLYGLTKGRWTFSFAAGAAQIICRESWPEAGLSAEKKAIGAVLAAGADIALFGPLGIFVRLEAGPTERKDEIVLGGFDAVGGLSLRF